MNDNRPNKDKDLIGLYELIISHINSLTPSIIKKTLTDGSGERLNGYIDELHVLTGDDRLKDFKVKIRVINNRACTYGEEYSRSLYGIVNYLFKTNDVIGYFCAMPPTNLLTFSDSSPVFTNQFNAEQMNQQSTTVYIEFNQTIISLTETLTNLENAYPEAASKENQFAKRLKSSLSTVKDTLGIIALVLKIAAEVGLNPEQALGLLNLS